MWPGRSGAAQKTREQKQERSTRKLDRTARAIWVGCIKLEQRLALQVQQPPGMPDPFLPQG